MIYLIILTIWCIFSLGKKRIVYGAGVIYLLGLLLSEEKAYFTSIYLGYVIFLVVALFIYCFITEEL